MQLQFIIIDKLGLLVSLFSIISYNIGIYNEIWGAQTSYLKIQMYTIGKLLSKSDEPWTKRLHLCFCKTSTKAHKHQIRHPGCEVYRVIPQLCNMLAYLSYIYICTWQSVNTTSSRLQTKSIAFLCTRWALCPKRTDESR